MAFMALRYVRLFWNFAFLCCEEICVAIDSPGGIPSLEISWNVNVLNIACWIMVQDGSRIFNSQSHATRLCCRLKEAAASAGSIWGNVRQAWATPRELVWDKLWQFTSGSFHSKTLLSRWRFGAHPCSCSTTAVATRENTRNLHHCPDLYSLYCLHTADTSETWLCTMLKRWNCWGFDISWRAPWLRPP